MSTPCAAGVLVCLLAGCVGDDVDSDGGLVSADGFPAKVSGVIAPVRGFYRQQDIELYDLGELNPRLNAAGEFAGIAVHPMYRFAQNGVVVAEQLPIVDVIPPSPGYSPFFQIVYVLLEDGLAPNDVKSQATLLRRGLTREYTDQVVHCPLLGPEATVVPSEAQARLVPIVELWFREKHARCLALEGGRYFVDGGLPEPAADAVVVGDRTTYTMPAQDVYLPEVRVFDEEVEVPGNLVTDLIAGDEGYSPVARVSEVLVKPTYQLGGFDELADIDPTLISARVPETYLDLPVMGILP